MCSPMRAEPSTSEKMRCLPWAIGHNATNTIFCQLTLFGPVFLLFLSDLGLPKTRIGLLLSLLPFWGLVAVFIAPAVARVGTKRTFVTFWTLRKLVVALFLLTPWVVQRFGLDGAFFYIVLLVAMFALFRAIAETAALPWDQEIIPSPVRGQYYALSNIIAMLCGSLALAGASYLLDHVAGIRRFAYVMGGGVLFGLISCGLALRLPGGAPRRKAGTAHIRQMRVALLDRNFRLYLAGMGLLTLSGALLFFMPLFFKEQVGLGEGQIARLGIASFAGVLLSSYLWGWTADRFGGKPVMLSSLSFSGLLLVGWVLMPRQSAWSNTVAMALSFIGGTIGAATAAGGNRLLYVGVVPP